jgi:2-polyprenyl-3-methyl-5-hydroxy-6-metoxy-1,4-benzoquinol methylase
MLGYESLKGKSFLDIGSGSGLFSLVARKLGASVYSFDYDPHSFNCTKELKRRYFKDDANWVVTQGSILDTDFLKSLSKFDIVYSWGVLHHTGSMWQAIENALIPLADNGEIFIALYNDQGSKSTYWTNVKKLYNNGFLGRAAVLSVFIPRYIVLPFFKDLVLLTNPAKRYTDYKKHRGMSRFYDFLDWWGGLPFEVASIEEVFHYFLAKGFHLKEIKTVNGGSGCNEFVFGRTGIFKT